ncbi:40S ribosomal S2-4 [Chlorella sorokiniana]|uniref:40S ribosomal S2-4 n=1 Tax=Chlorella sorokiniana TaxID=3076 RepID=A0A2P6U2A3_CHLSO|nr:40S ribosomal S2-4 [Chlorella sorokiniana]|eukprot:PRW60442.1 40S ribosomal S2-4 [Chlorella sorokiniana]
MRALLCALALAAAVAAGQAARPAADVRLADDWAPDCIPGENCSPFVNVTLYGEALCPYTAAFVTHTLAPLLPPGGRPYKTFWSIIQFRYVAWGNARNRSSSPPQCQHGAAECRLNRIINCAQQLNPSQRQWFPFVVCLQGTDRPSMESAVNGCAQDAGIDPVELRVCATGPLGTQLERQAAAKTDSLRPPHTYVPWVLVNRVPLFEHDPELKRYVCAAFAGRKPSSCWEPENIRAVQPPEGPKTWLSKVIGDALRLPASHAMDGGGPAPPAEASGGGFGGGRGGFGRGFGGRDDGEEKWVPVTKLGRLVQQGKIKSLESVFLFSLPVKEYQIIDYFLGGSLKDEKMTRAGQRTRMKVFVCVGDYNGHIGLGVKVAKEVATAIRGAIIMAKLGLVPVRRGYWGNKIGKVHTVPTKVTGHCGSVSVRLIPAPRGAGIVAARTPKKVLQMAGIEDCYTASRGNTKTQGNFVRATFYALASTYAFLSPDMWRPHPLPISPLQEFSDFLTKPEAVKMF